MKYNTEGNIETIIETILVRASKYPPNSSFLMKTSDLRTKLREINIRSKGKLREINSNICINKMIEKSKVRKFIFSEVSCL